MTVNINRPFLVIAHLIYKKQGHITVEQVAEVLQIDLFRASRIVDIVVEEVRLGLVDLHDFKHVEELWDLKRA